MLNRKIYIFFIFMLSIMLVPSISFACGSKSAKSNHKKEVAKTVKTKPCSNKCDHGAQEKGNCAGKCAGKSCKCPTVNASSALAFIAEITNDNFTASVEKQQALVIQTYPLSGFYSIWSPPNIS